MFALIYFAVQVLTIESLTDMTMPKGAFGIAAVDYQIDVQDAYSIIGAEAFSFLHSVVSSYDADAQRAAYLAYSRRLIESAITLARVAQYRATIQRPHFSEVRVNAPAKRIPSFTPDAVRQMVAAFTR